MNTYDKEALEHIVKECDAYLLSVENNTESKLDLSASDIALISELCQIRVNEINFLRSH